MTLRFFIVCQSTARGMMHPIGIFLRPVLVLALVICALLSIQTLAAAECAAAWESFAEQAMYDRAAAEGVLPANAFCSAEHLARAGNMRREFRIRLISALASGSAPARVWAHLFEIAAARSVGEMAIREAELVFSGKLLPLCNTAEKADFSAKKNISSVNSPVGLLCRPVRKKIFQSSLISCCVPTSRINRGAIWWSIRFMAQKSTRFGSICTSKASRTRNWSGIKTHSVFYCTPVA